jgi:hypothetical protein
MYTIGQKMIRGKEQLIIMGKCLEKGRLGIEERDRMICGKEQARIMGKL